MLIKRFRIDGNSAKLVKSAQNSHIVVKAFTMNDIYAQISEYLRQRRLAGK